MAWMIDDARIVSAAMMPAVREAAERGARLVGMWPLTDPKMLSNDARYGETLQVRVTRVMAAIMSGSDVAMADAEFIYEGADSIPGRPDVLVRALMSANDAYDAMSTYSQNGDIAVVMRGAAACGAEWDDDAVMAMSRAFDAIETIAHDPGPAQPRQAADVESISQRLGLVAVAFDGLLGVLDHSATSDGGPAFSVRGVAPLLPYVNELCERVAIGRVFVDVKDVESMVAARASADSEGGDDAVVRLFADCAGREWDRHRGDILWDPDEAERKAKEDDERRRREELNDRFSSSQGSQSAAES